MKKALSILALVGFIMFTVTSCKKENYENITATVAGTVIDVDTGEPIGNVTMTMTPGGLNTYTGSDGTFQFNDVEAQQYTLTAQKTGYGANRKTVNPNAGETVNVSITMKKE